MNKKLYTAVGHTQVNTEWNGDRYPVVIINGKEYILDFQEMILWCVCNWQLLSVDEAKQLYKKKETEFGITVTKTFEDCLKRLVQRGLLAEGIGNTSEAALYDLLSELYIIPVSENIFLRVFSFIRLTIFNRIPFSVARQLLGTDARSEDEKKVMRLAKRALLSTAEIIKCVEGNHLDFHTEEQLLDALYHDDITTCDTIAETSRLMKCCRPILSSVANLLLRKQIILERL